MKSWKKILITLGGIIKVVLFGIVVLFFYAMRGLCGNEIYVGKISPNKEHKAVVFERNCGATTGFSTHISIIDANKSLENGSGNIFIIDGRPLDVSPEISWQSNDEFKIKRKLNGTEHKADRSWGFINKIRVTYESNNNS